MIDPRLVPLLPVKTIPVVSAVLIGIQIIDVIKKIVNDD